MKYVLTAYECRPRVGTEAGLAWNWARALIEAGREVTVVTNRRSAQDTTARRQWRDLGVTVLGCGPLEDVKAPNGLASMHRARRGYLHWVSEVRELLRVVDADVVHHLTWSSVRLPPPFLERHDTETIWGPLGGGHRAPLRHILPTDLAPELARNISIPLAEYQARGWHRLVSHALATNDESRAFLERAGFLRVSSMLTDGIEKSMILSTPRVLPGRTLNLLWIGRLVSTKRPDLAVRTMKLLRDSGLSVRLTVAGDGPGRSSLEGLVKELGLADAVVFRGFVPWDEVTSLYDDTDLLLFTSMRDSSCPAIVEAAGRGVPTVAVRHQGVGACVPATVARGPGPGTTPSRLPNHLAIAVHELVADKSYADASEQALAFAAQQTWDSKVQRVLALIGQV